MKARRQVLGLAGVAAFLLLSELSSRAGLVDPRFMPPASDIVGELMANLVHGKFWIAAGQTMQAWAIGLAISIVLGVVLGFVIGSSTVLRRLTNSTVEFLRPIPSVALIPLAVLLFGVKIESSLMLIIYASFWQIFIQVLYGVADVDNIAMQTARSYGLNSLARIRYVVFPTTLPYLMTGVRLATAVALILAVTAGLVIGSPGLGREIALAQSGGAVTEMYALAVATGLIGVGINVAMRNVEQRVLSWHSSVRSEAIV